MCSNGTCLFLLTIYRTNLNLVERRSSGIYFSWDCCAIDWKKYYSFYIFRAERLLPFVKKLWRWRNGKLQSKEMKPQNGLLPLWWKQWDWSRGKVTSDQEVLQNRVEGGRAWEKQKKRIKKDYRYGKMCLARIIQIHRLVIIIWLIYMWI